MNCIEMVEMLGGCGEDFSTVEKVRALVKKLDFGDDPDLKSRQVVAAIMVLDAKIGRLEAEVQELSRQIFP